MAKTGSLPPGVVPVFITIRLGSSPQRDKYLYLPNANSLFQVRTEVHLALELSPTPTGLLPPPGEEGGLRRQQVHTYTYSSHSYSN